VNARLFAETSGIGVNLVLELQDGSKVYGFGSGEQPMRDCRGMMGGLFVVNNRAAVLSQSAGGERTGRWLLAFD